jgi:hypothetical protein
MTRITAARYISGYRLWLRFNDGVEGEVDLENEIDGPVFEPLEDPAVFKGFTVHTDLHTVTWPCGADFAPEFLRRLVTAKTAA